MLFKIAIKNLTDSFSEEKKDYIDLLSKYSICLSDSINLFLKIGCQALDRYLVYE